jgi:hypothetical protein
MRTQAIFTSLAVAALSLFPSKASATGYYLAAANFPPRGSSVVGYEGFSQTPITFFSSPVADLVINFPYAALEDFDGNGIPEVVVTNSTSSSLYIYPDFGAKPVVSFYYGSLGDTGGPISISGSTITVHSVNGPLYQFTYDPPGDPEAPSPIFDLDGDGIADTATIGSTNLVFTHNGATGLDTLFQGTFPAHPDSLVNLTWSPSITASPEPSSLCALALGIPLLLKRRC